METLKRMAIVAAAVISASMALTACGGSEGGSNTDSKSAETTTTAATTAAAETTTTAATTTAAAEEKPAETTAAADTGSKDAPAKKDKSIVAKKKDTKPEPPAEQASAPSEYAQAIANTIWVGMDANYNCYAMAFTDQEIVFEADDGSSIEGYWGVVEGDPTFYIFSDAELTDPIFAMPWAPDFEKKVLVINDNIVMGETSGTDFSQALELLQQQSALCKIAAYLDGTYWAGQNPDGSYTAMGMQGAELGFYEIEPTGEESTGSYLWGLDMNGLTLYDTEYNPLITMGIVISDDGSQMQMVKADGSSTVLTQVSSDDATNIVAYLHSLAEGGAEGGADTTEGGEEAGEGEEEYVEGEEEE